MPALSELFLRRHATFDLVFHAGIRLVSLALIAAVSMPSLAQEDPEQSAQAGTSGYTLDAGDMINIRVLQEEELSLEIEIGESGSITYPLLGEVRAAGLTTSELEARMRFRLIDEEYLVNPDISINISEYRSFYINGEVSDPGAYPFEPGLTLRRAVSLAGGFTPRASRTRISILSSDNEEVDTADADDILEMRINPGDIITVNQRFF